MCYYLFSLKDEDKDKDKDNDKDKSKDKNQDKENWVVDCVLSLVFPLPAKNASPLLVPQQIIVVNIEKFANQMVTMWQVQKNIVIMWWIQKNIVKTTNQGIHFSLFHNRSLW